MPAASGAADVIIAGGGVMGCATAYFLAQAGARVTLLEQHRIGGSPSASGASAAILEPLGGSAPALAAQAQLSRSIIDGVAPRLLEQTGIDIEWQRLGSVHMAFSERDADALRSHVPSLFQQLGEATVWLDQAELRRMEPAVSPRALGGLHIPSTNGLYAPKYVRALAAGAAAVGARVLQGVSVTGFDVAGDRVAAVRTSEGTLPAGQVVLATGGWTRAVSQWLGRTVPVGPQRGQITALAPAPGQPRVSRVLHGPGGYIIPKANGTACVGATHEEVGFDARVTTYGMQFLADLALRLAPGLETATVKHTWMGFRPIMEGGTGMPAVGALPGLRNAYVAAGHGAIGVTVSAAAGHLLAQLIRGVPLDQPLDAFDPADAVA